MPKERPNLKIDLARGRGQAGEIAPWRYDGNVTRGAEAVAVTAVVTAEGTVTVGCADAVIAERIRLLLRACYKQSQTEGLRAPPRKIVRWRDERV